MCRDQMRCTALSSNVLHVISEQNFVNWDDGFSTNTQIHGISKWIHSSDTLFGGLNKWQKGSESTLLVSFLLRTVGTCYWSPVVLFTWANQRFSVITTGEWVLVRLACPEWPRFQEALSILKAMLKCQEIKNNSSNSESNLIILATEVIVF